MTHQLAGMKPLLGKEGKVLIYRILNFSSSLRGLSVKK
jgi:hypothetical protein